MCEGVFPFAGAPADAAPQGPAEPAPAAADDEGFTLEPAPEPPPPQDEAWYIAVGNELRGPLDARQIVAAARSGEITPTTVLRHGKKAISIEAGQVPGLFAPRAAPMGQPPVARPSRKAPPDEQPPLAGEPISQAPPVEPAPPSAPEATPRTPQPEAALPQAPDPAEQAQTSFDTALVALALSEVTDAASPEQARRQPSEPLGGGEIARILLLWGLRGTLALAGWATFLPWLVVTRLPAAPDSPARTLDLFDLNTWAGVVLLLSLAAGIALSFVAPRRQAFTIILALAMLGTTVVVLIPFCLYGTQSPTLSPALRAALDEPGPARTAMAWGAWLCLGLCVLACLEAIIYLFVPGTAPAEPLLARRRLILRR